MGVQGLTTFLHKKNLLENHRLHDTVLVIDGFNLIYHFYFEDQKKTNDHMYGGDYARYACNLKRFIQNLKKCNVQPIVVFDGSIDPSMEKLKTVLRRSENNLNTARKIYENNSFIEGILPMLACSVYCLQLEKLDVPVYQTSFEADQMIIQMAFDLKCPILSNDSDFYLYNLPGGIINLKSVFDFDCTIQKEDFRYVRCKIYKVTHLERFYPTINMDLVQIVGFILGNDYVDPEITAQITKKISQFNDRYKMICDIFTWISKFRSLDSLVERLSSLLKNPGHPFIKIIQKHFVQLQNSAGHQPEITSNLEDYFRDQVENILLKDVQMPLWMRSLFIKKKIDRLFLTISRCGIDWCRPLVEDFSFEKSSYETVAPMMKYIYGILYGRTDDNCVQTIRKYCRQKVEFRPEKIPFNTVIGDDRRLPKLNEIELLEQNDREALFFQCLQLDGRILPEMQNILEGSEEMDRAYDYQLLKPFCSMLICLLFMIRNFPGDVWLEFVYAVFLNIWLTGYLCPESSTVFLKLDNDLKQKLEQNLFKYSAIPVLSSSKVYMPRVVHFYNSYQVCLDRIDFLSNILNVKNIFNLDVMLFALKGTFLYNLTAELSSRPKPLLFLEQLLERKQFKVLNVFLKLLDYIMDNSGRMVWDDGKTSSYDKYIITDSLMKKTANGGDENGHHQHPDSIQNHHGYLVRAFDVTNKKTHINSQKLKLAKK